MNDERLMQVLLVPHVSEKTTRLSDSANQVVFRVLRDARKAEIKQAVETLFEVEVDRVTTANVKGKVKKNFRGVVSKSKNWKKAYVRVAAGQDIDFTRGVQ